jgi:hypothetical protein
MFSPCHRVKIGYGVGSVKLTIQIYLLSWSTHGKIFPSMLNMYLFIAFLEQGAIFPLTYLARTSYLGEAQFWMIRILDTLHEIQDVD